MPLSPALDNAMLTRPCPNCGHKLEKRGVWFKAVGRYVCEGCQLYVLMNYLHKVELFDAYAHLIRKDDPDCC